MTMRYALHQEDRVFLQHVESALVSLLQRTNNTPKQAEALAALLAGMWNLPSVTPGLTCALEYQPSEVAMRFEMNQEAISFRHGESFHATFWPEGHGQHVGSRWGESSDRREDYHSWKVLLEMFENDLACNETEFSVELLGRPSLDVGIGWAGLPSWEAKGVSGLTDIQA